MGGLKSIVMLVIAICVTIAGFYFFTPSASERLTYDPEFQAEMAQLFAPENRQAYIKSKSIECPKEGVSAKEKELCELTLMLQILSMQLKEAFRQRGPFSLGLLKLTKQEANAVHELIRIRLKLERLHNRTLPDSDMGPNPIVDFDLGHMHTDGFGIRGNKIIMGF